jgi:integrase
MPKIPKALSPLEVRRLAEPGKYAVGGVRGLYLYVSDTGARSWVLRMLIGQKRREAGLGPYPEVQLAEARDRAREFRKAVQEGRDPIAERERARMSLIANQDNMIAFEDAALACHRAKAPEFKSARHSKDWLSTLRRHAFPVIGTRPVGDLAVGDILRVLEPIWTTKTETATRVRQRIETVLAWATVSGYRSGENPARWRDNLDQLLPKPSKVAKVKHFAALPWQQMGAFMRDLRKRDGQGARALEFAILTAARSGEVRGMSWDEIDLDRNVWTVPADRIKAGKQHRVPLSAAARAVLKATPHRDGLVFRGVRGGPLSDMSLSAVTKRMGADAVPHGFRSTFKDWCRNATGYPDEASELALAHVSSDATRAAYARDELLSIRARMMEDWAKFCSTPLEAGKVVAMGQQA